MISINLFIPAPERGSFRQVSADLKLSRVPCIGEHVALGDLCFEVVMVVHDTPDSGREAEVYARQVDKLDTRRKLFGM